MAPIARVEGQLLASLKSGAFFPLMLMPAILSSRGPVFVRLTCWAELLVPTTCAANVRLVGDSDPVGVCSRTEKVELPGAATARSSSPSRLKSAIPTPPPASPLLHDGML